MSVYIPALAETNIKKLTATMHQMAQGATNAANNFTLNANSTSTLVKFVASTPTTSFFITWQPTTAHAAGQMATLFCTGATKGQFILSHSSNPTTDQTFNFQVGG